MSDYYQHGYVIDINSYGTNSIDIIDNEERDIIKITYNITIKANDGSILILKSNSIKKIEKNKEIHFMYDKNDNYIYSIIENPEQLWEELKNNKLRLNNKLSFLKILKESIKNFALPTLLPTSLIIFLIIFFSGETYNFSTIISGFIFYWFFFLSILSILLSIIQYPTLHFIHSNMESDCFYYQSFIKKYNRSKLNLKKNEDIKNEYIQEK